MKKFLVLLAALSLMTFGLNAYALTDKAHGKDFGVRNSNGDYVGTISKILADPLGDIAFVVLSLEKGGKEIIVPLHSLSQDGKEGLVLDLSEREIAAAPEFDISSLEDPTYASKIYKFYGMVPPWAEGTTGGGKE